MKKQIAVYFLAFTLLFANWPVRSLLLMDEREQKLLVAVPFSHNDRVTVEWVHSVERTPWRETYALDDEGDLRLVETSFRSFGAGVPAAFEQPVQVEEGWITVKGLNLPRDSVSYLISRDDFTLTMGTHTWQATRIVPKDHSLQLTVGLLPWWVTLIYDLPGEDVKADESTRQAAFGTGDEQRE
ncbi:MAG: DUF1850 domain-containing protein [Brevibacillus sp.]|nr:DUF1850 domain-containing protein [Brevibacillus sp.]